MKKEMLNYIANNTRVSENELNSMSWQRIVDEVILPKIAGRSNRWHITDEFMAFMADFGKECIEMDKSNGTNLAPVLFTVAMQRLSKGALKHKGVQFDKQLPKKYWEYSSAHDDYGIMTPGCLQFIYYGLPVAAQFAPTREYALIQAWGLVEHLDAQGNRNDFDLYCDSPSENGIKLYDTGLRLVEQWTKEEELYEHFASPEQWRKHLDWFHAHQKMFQWDDFFSRIYDPAGKGWFKRWSEKRAIKKEIRNA